MIILGIDPGTQRIGYAILELKNKKASFKTADILKIKKNDFNKLIEIEAEIQKLIKKWKPKILSIEKIYFSRNQKTAMAVSEARGIILLAALKNNIKILEYAPNEIKLKIAGYGFADKKAVEKMVRLILNLKNQKFIDDAIDALALSLVASKEIDLTK
jgi:crossover junction endodeoxyribonuclease RuvC